MIYAGQFSDKDPNESPVILKVHVVPNSRNNSISEVMEDGTLKIHIKAPPVEGKANKAILDFLSKFFDWPKTKIKIIQGEKSRRKLIVIEGMNWRTVQAVIKEEIKRL